MSAHRLSSSPSSTRPGRRVGLGLAAAALVVAPLGGVAWAEPGSGGAPASPGRSAGHAQPGAPASSSASSSASPAPGRAGKSKGAQPAPAKPAPAQPAPAKAAPAKPAPAKPAPAAAAPSASTADPSGNNGTVKIAPHGELDGIPQNTPHVGCDFQIEWYGFDEGDDVVSTVWFAAQSPTRDSQITVDGPSTVTVGEDAASGAGTDSGLDAVQVYTLSFTGEPHAQQGYHVKLTVHTPRSRGNDTKTKVFWVQECEAPTTPTPTPTPEVSPTPEVTPTPEVVPTQEAAPDLEVLGVEASAPAQSQQPLVPTVINAGMDAAAELGVTRTSAPWLGLGLALLGLLLGVVARQRKSRA